jgi:glycosyltransferase involved in cell wall biosynthesis
MNHRERADTEPPVISVLTAALDPPPAFMLDALRSLQAQDEVRWEWVIQLDGEDPPPPPQQLLAEPRVSVRANGRRLGSAATRNRALVRTQAALVQNLDADDQLLPGALAAGRQALAGDAELAFAFGRTVDLLPDGSRRGSWREQIPFAPGRIEAGAIGARWLQSGSDPLPLSPIIYRRRLLFAYGGWAALSVLEDTALVLALAERHPCFYIDRDTQLYRVHPAQMTAAPGYRAERRPNLRFVFERLRALGAGGAEAGVEPPPDPAERLTDRQLRRGL